jgi:hypothetical protein
MTLLYAGVAIWVNAIWPLLFLPLALVVMQVGVISREEAYLERVFGDAYREYRRRVRRWLRGEAASSSGERAPGRLRAGEGRGGTEGRHGAKEN